MRKILVLLLFLPSLIFGQNQKINKFQIDAGFIIHKNFLNEDDYLNFKTPASGLNDLILTGIDLRITFSSRWDNIDIVVGTLIERSGDRYYTITHDHIMNGGGVYAGITPHTKGKNIGLTSTFAIGVLSYKDYYSYYSDNPPPVIDIYEKKASFGLGALSSVGLYLKAGPVGINPQVNAVFSGGHEASFLFYGVVLPVTIQF